MKTNRWLIFSVCSLLFVMSMLYRASIILIAPEISHDLQLSAQDLGLLGAIFFYAFGLAQLPLGFFLDQMRPKRIMLFLNMTAVFGAIVFAAAPGYGVGLLGRSLLGLGMSANIVGSLTLYVAWFKPSEFASVAGLTFGIGALGGLLATSPLHALVAVIGWRMVFVVLAFITFILTVGFYFIVQDNPNDETPVRFVPESHKRLSVRETCRRLFTDFSYVCIAITTGLRYGVYAAVQSLWAGPFLILYLGVPTLLAANLLLVLNIGFIFGGPLAGLLNDRLFGRPKRIMLASLFFMVLCLAGLAAQNGPDRTVLLAGLLFTFGLFGGFGHIAFAHIKTLITPELSGRAFAINNFCSMMGGGLFIHGLGSFIGRGTSGSLDAGKNYPLAFWLCATALIVGAVIYTFSRDTLIAEKETEDPEAEVNHE